MTYVTEEDLRSGRKMDLEVVGLDGSRQSLAEWASGGYEGVTHAGIAVVAADTGRVLLAQRAFDATDDPSVAETWEFPGGSLETGENPIEGAEREFSEEIGVEIPPGEVINGWRGGDNPETGHFQGFVYQIRSESDLDLGSWVPTDEVQAAGFYSSDEVQDLENAGVMRPEIVATMDWTLVFPETVQGDEMPKDVSVAAAALADEPDDTDYSAIFAGPIPLHGVLAPEEVETGDKRGFKSGSMTSRAGRLPFRWADRDNGAHDGAVAVGSVDRLMRKDGLIHWEGSLMPGSDKADEFANLLAFFGRFGVSVDGDKGSLDLDETARTGVAWFDAVRAAGLTAVDIPAFQEAYVAFGPHPDMPAEDTEEFAVLAASGNVATFKRGPGWVTDPAATRRIHDYWMPGHPGGDKIQWGTGGDFTRAKALIGEKILKNSPDKARFLNQIIAQWHHDALGYWPGDLDKPGNKTTAEARAERKSALSVETAQADDGVWEAVLTASGGGKRVQPPVEYFHKHPKTFGTVIDEPDVNGFRRTYGYAAEWGVCHIGHDGRCVEAPRTYSDDYPDFHKGRMKVAGGGFVPTGLLTYNVDHRDAKRILSESATQQHFDNLKNAWAAVRVGEDENGIWFSGVVLPKVDEDDLVKIAASGQVSGEWKYGTMRALLTVNVEGFGVTRASAEYDEAGNVVALAASAFNDALTASINGVENSPCNEVISPWRTIQALRQIDAEVRFAALRDEYLNRKASR